MSEYETILSKAKKVAELAEKGIAGEAEAAKMKLRLLMDKYGLSFSDLSNETTKEYDFKYRAEEEYELLMQIVYTVCKTKQVRNGSYRRGDGLKVGGTRWFELTPYQYVEIGEMFDFHVRQLRKEIKAIKDQIVNAYVNKHGIFPPNHENSGEHTMEECLKVSSLINLLDDDVKFHKALNK